MSPADARTLSELVDIGRYPLVDPASPEWRRVIAGVHAELAAHGCCVLEGFMRPDMIGRLRDESEGLAPHAYYALETVNVYNIPLDADLPDDHPGRRTMERGNAFVAHDLIPTTSLIHRIYTDATFHRFVGDCFGLAEVHPLADPLAGLCVNVIPPGRQHPWHFDTNEYTVSLLTVEQEAGGLFEYCPGIRSARSESLDDVRAVLDGEGHPTLRRLHLRPGDLQLFTGRYSLHRVSTVEGGTARQSAIFAYTARPGIVSSAERTRQLFGRVLPVHHGADRAAVAVDELLD
jgi:hypothetical protein